MSRLYASAICWTFGSPSKLATAFSACSVRAGGDQERAASRAMVTPRATAILPLLVVSGHFTILDHRPPRRFAEVKHQATAFPTLYSTQHKIWNKSPNP